MRPERTRVAAYALIVDESRILLVRISAEVPGAVGQWTLPGGGLEFGEQPEAGVVREVREETGLCVETVSVANVHSQLFENADANHHMVRILYQVRVVGGELCNELSGSTDLAQWFTREEALRLPLVEVARLGVELALGA